MKERDKKQKNKCQECTEQLFEDGSCPFCDSNPI
tara:strand:- start:364 stop:465 length:102 start_codon:yes stop_codon:yes gene_type:complete